MILPLSAALPAAAGPLWLGGAAPAAQRAIPLAFGASLSLWAAVRGAGGFFPLPPAGLLAWCLCLAALQAAAALASPAGADWTAWLVQAQALALVPAAALLSRDGRSRVDAWVRASAWILAALAAYQRVVLGDPCPSSSFPDSASWSAAVLMFLALAADSGDALLGALLLACLAWSGSVGAWLGLFCAFFWKSRTRGGFWPAAGTVGVVLALGGLYNKLGSPELMQRWVWWKGAGRLIAARPVLGWGPGGFARALALGVPGAPVTGDPRSFPLQAAAEWGVPAACLWVVGLLRISAAGASPKRLGVIAVLVGSMLEGALNAPACLWLLSYLAGSSVPEESRGVNVPLRWKPALCAAGFGAAAALAWRLSAGPAAGPQ